MVLDQDCLRLIIKPLPERASPDRLLYGFLSADFIRASGHANRAKKAGHMSAPDPARLISENLCIDGAGKLTTELSCVEIIIVIRGREVAILAPVHRRCLIPAPD